MNFEFKRSSSGYPNIKVHRDLKSHFVQPRDNPDPTVLTVTAPTANIEFVDSPFHRNKNPDSKTSAQLHMKITATIDEEDN